MRKKSSTFFPQISCKKTAKVFKKRKSQGVCLLAQSLKLLILLFFSSFLFLNLHTLFFPKNERLAKARRELLRFPFNPQVHLNLAKIYLEEGNLSQAEKELSLAENLSSSPSAELESLKKKLQKAKKQPEKIRQEISFWEKIVKEKPDYRDAYFQLAVLNYQIYQKKKAQKYLKKTLELDPDFEPAQKLEKILQE